MNTRTRPRPWGQAGGVGGLGKAMKGWGLCSHIGENRPKYKKNYKHGWVWWLTSVITQMQEVEIGRIAVQRCAKQKVS
jgi:hypothetical protein